MYATPFASVGASACTQRTSGHNGDWFHVLFAMIESAPTPEPPCAAVPPLNSNHMSPAAIPAIGLPFTSWITSLTRALLGRLVPPSLFGHMRNRRVARVPSVGDATVPVCGT